MNHIQHTGIYIIRELKFSTFLSRCVFVALFTCFFLNASGQGISASSNQNYIQTNVIKAPNVTVEANASTLADSDVNRTIQYFDGLGRPSQTIQVKASPLGKDIIVPFAYDAFGREAIKYEPYADPGTANGSYRATAITNQSNFYKEGTAPASIQWTNSPFSKTIFEASPLSRVLEQGFPGYDWQPSSSRTTSTGRTVVSEYLINDSLEVPLFKVTSTGISSSSLFYGKGRLYKTIIKDENWTSGKVNTTEEYKDIEGRVIMKRVWQSNTVSLSTYYVYDDLGNLRFVVPPFPGSASLTTLNETDDLVKKYCYVYHYDGRQRLIEKRIPGKDWEYLVYNKLDQVVLTQDGNQRPKRHWFYTKYDALGRIAVTGIYLHGSVASRESIQNTVNAQPDSVPLWETWTGSEYSSNTFPTSTLYYHQLFKYDNYEGPIAKAYKPASNDDTKTKGLLTVTWNYVDLTTWKLANVNHYDDYGRVVKNFKQHYADPKSDTLNYDETTNTYNFVGDLLSSTRVHKKRGASNLTIATENKYDAWSRHVKTLKKNNSGGQITLSEKFYNETGRGVKEKQLYNGLHKMTYVYGQRGWLKEMRSSEFTEVLMYGDSSGGNRQFNGNIAYQKWGYQINTPGVYSYTYDGLNRLTKGSSTPASTNMSEEVSYDSMGNILTMKRNGTTGTYSYSGNQLTKITGFETQPYVYYYDANGNMTKNGRNGDSLTYNALNIPKSVSRAGVSVAYVHTMDGNKIKTTTTIDGVKDTTIYVDGIHYNGKRIDFIQTEEGVARRNGTSYSYEFHLADHLGNVRIAFHKNPSTNLLEVIQKTNYFPFGKASVGTAGINKYLYNGKELQSESETYDYGARFYDPVIGRWNVIDALAEKFYSFSQYNFVLNNPLKYIDPDGNDIILVVRGQGNAKDRTLTYRNGNAYWNDTGKKYNWRGANNTVARVLKAYQKIEKSNDVVLKDQLHALEKSDKHHFVEPGSRNRVKITEGELGSAKEGDRVSTTTTFNFSEENKKSFEESTGVKSSDLSTVSHELQHQYDYDQGNMKDSEPSSSKDPAEIRAVINENRARKIEGLPKRTSYGGKEIDKKKLNP